MSELEIAAPATATLARGDLARVAAPAMLIASADSPPSIEAIVASLAAALPLGARVVCVPGAGHMVPLSHPEAVSAAIRDFLELDKA